MVSRPMCAATAGAHMPCVMLPFLLSGLRKYGVTEGEPTNDTYDPSNAKGCKDLAVVLPSCWDHICCIQLQCWRYKHSGLHLLVMQPCTTNDTGTALTPSVALGGFARKCKPEPLHHSLSESQYNRCGPSSAVGASALLRRRDLRSLHLNELIELTPQN